MGRIYIEPVLSVSWAMRNAKYLAQRRSYDKDVSHVAFVLKATASALRPVFWNSIAEKHTNKYNALMAMIITGEAHLQEIEG